MVQSKDTRLALDVLRVGTTDREDSARVASMDMRLAEDSLRSCGIFIVWIVSFARGMLKMQWELKDTIDVKRGQLGNFLSLSMNYLRRCFLSLSIAVLLIL